MEAIQLPRPDTEWKLILKKPEIDQQLIRMLNTFSVNRAGDAFMQNCRGVHRMFLEKFGRHQNLSDSMKEYLQRRADEWTNLVDKTFSRKLEAQVTGEEFNDMGAMFKLQQFLRQTASVLSLP